MTLRRPASGRGRAFDWSLWAAAACPLWALMVFSWVVLGQLCGEVREVARYYGIYVGKEALRAALARVASAIELARGERQGPREGSVSEEICGSIFSLSGLERFLLVLERERLNPVCLGGPGQGEAGSALADEGFREGFFHVLRQMDRQQATEGLFSLGKRSGRTGSPEKWFVLLQPAGPQVLCVLLLPESELNRAGGSLEEALSVLVKRRRRRYLFFSAGFCNLLSAVIALLVKNGRPRSAPKQTGGTHDGRPKAPYSLGGA